MLRLIFIGIFCITTLCSCTKSIEVSDRVFSRFIQVSEGWTVTVSLFGGELLTGSGAELSEALSNAEISDKNVYTAHTALLLVDKEALAMLPELYAALSLSPECDIALAEPGYLIENAENTADYSELLLSAEAAGRGASCDLLEACAGLENGSVISGFYNGISAFAFSNFELNRLSDDAVFGLALLRGKAHDAVFVVNGKEYYVTSRKALQNSDGLRLRIEVRDSMKKQIVPPSDVTLALVEWAQLAVNELEAAECELFGFGRVYL